MNILYLVNDIQKSIEFAQTLAIQENPDMQAIQDQLSCAYSNLETLKELLKQENN